MQIVHTHPMQILCHFQVIDLALVIHRRFSFDAAGDQGHCLNVVGLQAAVQTNIGPLVGCGSLLVS
jgi:hypothetical protein